VNSRRAFLGFGVGVVGIGVPRLVHAAVHRIYIQPLGDELPAVDLVLVERAVRVMLGVQVVVLKRVALPTRAYYPVRRRYRAERLLTYLNTRLPADGTHILGLTGVDISTTKGKFKDWGVLGLGELPGTAGVISSFRCHMKSSGNEHARQRLAKVAVHEIGHTLGLPHCPSLGCLMEDAGGKVATCDREFDFCARCRGLLARSGRPLPVDPVLPWPRPV
jgi:archaemetzincin